MATTDANGQVFYGPTDPIEPIQSLFNGISTAVSSKLGATTQIGRIANVAGRAAAVSARSARPITAADPLWVLRTDAARGRQLEATDDGTNWYAVSPPDLTRKVAQTSSGTLSSGSSVNLAADQTVTAQPFGVRDWQVEHTARVRVSVPAGLGVLLDLTLNGSAYSSTYWTNPGSSAHTVTLAVSDIVEVTGTSTANIVLNARVTAVAGTITIQNAPTNGGSNLVASPRAAL